MQEKNKKIKILAWIDSPVVATGFGVVSRNIFNYLAKTGKYDIDIIGVNDRGGWKDPKKFPYRIYPAKSGVSAETDFYGRPKFIASVLGTDRDLIPPWDIIFTLNDPFILEQPIPVFRKGTLEILKETQKQYKKKLPPKYWFKLISYWPVDSYLKGNWVEKAIALSDVSVVYTKYGKEEIIKADEFLDRPTNIGKRIKIIYHGVDFNTFKPVSEKLRKEFRTKFSEGKIKEETFLVAVIARNQQRKDLPRTMNVFKEFQKRRPDSFLYFHCQETDAWGSLREYARNWDLKVGEDWGVPAEFSANIGFPTEIVNLVYNAADCILSTSVGEGFGFYNIEGFATKTLVVASNNTSHPELFNYDKDEDISDMDRLYKKVRGVPAKCYTTSSEWATYGAADFERIRPLVNVDDMVKKLLWVYDNPDKVKQITDRAYKWIQDYDWKIIAKKWDDLFQETYDELEKERALFQNLPTKKSRYQRVKLKF